MSVNYSEQVRRLATRTPDQIAVIDSDRTISWKELDGRVTQLTNALTDAGVARGDRVGFVGENTSRPLEVMLACCRAGFIYVPIDFRLSGHEMRANLSDCQPTAVVIDDTYSDAARVLKGGLDSVSVWVMHYEKQAEPKPDFYDYDFFVSAADGNRREVDVDDEEVMCILYTSGTTGRAKGVTHTHRASFDNAVAVILAMELDSSSRFVVSYPHNSTAVVNHTWGSVIVAGGCVVMTSVREFSAEKFFHTVEEHSVTHCQLVPTMLFRLLDHPDRARFDLTTLEVIAYASAPIPPNRVEETFQAFGPILVQFLGMTEASTIAALSKMDHVRAARGEARIFSSCGRALAGIEVVIVGEDGRPLPVGEVGEIAVRGRWTTQGYWNDPARTAEAIRDGWLHSGDLGRMDDEEYIYIVDRKKDLIITGGANVASVEVEATLYQHPSVSEVAVIGVPDQQWGERVHAVVALRSESGATADELIAFCRERLSHFKAPKSVELLDALPHTSTGKIAKAALRAQRR